MISRATRLFVDTVILGAFIYGFVEATGFTESAQWLPLYASLIGGVLALGNLSIDLWQTFGRTADRDSSELIEGDAEFQDNVRSSLVWICWMTAFVVLIVLFGIYVATLIWLSAFFLRHSSMPKVRMVISTTAALAGLYALHVLTPIHLPEGLIL